MCWEWLALTHWNPCTCSHVSRSPKYGTKTAVCWGEGREEEKKKKKSKGGWETDVQRRPPLFPWFRWLLRLVALGGKWTTPLDCLSERENKNNGYAYAGKSVGLGVSALVEKRAAMQQREEARGQQRSSLVGLKRTPLPASPYAHRCSSAEVWGFDEREEGARHMYGWNKQLSKKMIDNLQFSVIIKMPCIV